MTKKLAGAIVTCAAVLLSAGLVFSADQSSPGLPVKNAEQKQPSKAAPDNWSKMKDCAGQSVRAMAERGRRNISLGVHAEKQIEIQKFQLDQQNQLLHDALDRERPGR